MKDTVIESHYHLRGDSGFLQAVLYRPAAGLVQGGLLVCDALFEERKSSQRLLVDMSRELASRHTVVLRFDYRGCGDSDGEFAEFSLDDWRGDIAVAFAELQAQAVAVPCGIFGLRFGGALAVDTVLRGGIAAEFIVLWAPVLEGESWFAAELRKKLMKEAITHGASRSSREMLVQELAAGNSIDFDGYEVTPTLYSGLRELCPDLGALRIPALAVSLGADSELARRLALPAVAASVARIDHELFRVPPFWNQIGYVPCPEVIIRSRDWIAHTAWRLRTAPSTAVSAGASAVVAAVGRAQSRQDMLVSAWSIAEAEEDAALEFTVTFQGAVGSVQAVLHTPENPDREADGVVFCHGWSGSRLGPHRMFVKMARRLTKLGYYCLRPDFGGRGNSQGEFGDGTVAGMAGDTVQALEYLLKTTSVSKVWLLGICSGGKVAISAAVADQRPAGLMLWSAEAMGSLRNPVTNAYKGWHVLRTYMRKATNPVVWKKLVTGRVNIGGVRNAVLKPETPSAAEAQWENQVLSRFRYWRRPVLFVYGSNDPDTRLAGEQYQQFCMKNGVPYEFHEIPEANHSFYSLDWEKEVMGITEQWMRQRQEIPGQ